MWECKDCGSKWWPRKEKPDRCPRCQRQNIFQSGSFDKKEKDEKSDNKNK